jgi:hypothetical protein
VYGDDFGPDRNEAQEPAGACGYEFHEAADFWPLMSEEEIAVLTADIEANGQIKACVLLDDKVLLGRNRMRACERLKIEPKITHLSDNWNGDPAKLVASDNKHRLHVSNAQIDEAGRLLTLKLFGFRSPKFGDSGHLLECRAEAARILGIADHRIRDSFTLHNKLEAENAPDYVKQAAPVILDAIATKWISTTAHALAVVNKPEDGDDSLPMWTDDYQMKRRRKRNRTPKPKPTLSILEQLLKQADVETFLEAMERTGLPRYEKLTASRRRPTSHTKEP